MKSPVSLSSRCFAGKPQSGKGQSAEIKTCPRSLHQQKPIMLTSPDGAKGPVLCNVCFDGI